MRKRKSKPPRRNLAARKAINQKAAVLKDRRQPRAGARNTFREDLRELE